MIIATALFFSRRAPRARLEDDIQAGIVTFLRSVLPAQDYRVFAVPNGGARGKAEAGRMKATGTLAGVFDVCILARGGSTYWLETKTDRGRLSEAQREMRDFMVAAGVPHALVRSIDDARDALHGWGIATREVAA